MPLVSVGVFFDYAGYLLDIQVLRRRRKLRISSVPYDSFNYGNYFTPTDKIPQESYNPTHIPRNRKRVAYLTGGSFNPSSFEVTKPILDWACTGDNCLLWLPESVGLFPDIVPKHSRRRPELLQNIFWCPVTPVGLWTEPAQSIISSSWTEPAQSPITSSWTEPGTTPNTSTWIEPAITPN